MCGKEDEAHAAHHALASCSAHMVVCIMHATLIGQMLRATAMPHAQCRSRLPIILHHRATVD